MLKIEGEVPENDPALTTELTQDLKSSTALSEVGLDLMKKEEEPAPSLRDIMLGAPITQPTAEVKVMETMATTGEIPDNDKDKHQPASVPFMEQYIRAKANEFAQLGKWQGVAVGIINRQGGSMVNTRLTYDVQIEANNAWTALYGRTEDKDKPDNYSAKGNLSFWEQRVEEILGKHTMQGVIDWDAIAADDSALNVLARKDESEAWHAYCLVRLSERIKIFELVTGGEFKYQPMATPTKETPAGDSVKTAALAKLKARMAG